MIVPAGDKASLCYRGTRGDAKDGAVRSLSADAAIIAAPSLAAAGGAIWSAERLFALVGHLPSALMLPSMAAIAFGLTWAAYHLIAGLLAYRALSTSNALVLLLTLVTLLSVLALLVRPELLIPLLASASGSATALRLLRRRPRRQLRPV